MQLHQHHYTSHLLCHSNSLCQSSSLREQSLYIFSFTIMFKTGLLLILNLFVEAPWCMLAENRNKLSSIILCWNIYPLLNGIETTKCFRKILIDCIDGLVIFFSSSLSLANITLPILVAIVSSPRRYHFAYTCNNYLLL